MLALTMKCLGKNLLMVFALVGDSTITSARSANELSPDAVIYLYMSGKVYVMKSGKQPWLPE